MDSTFCLGSQSVCPVDTDHQYKYTHPSASRISEHVALVADTGSSICLFLMDSTSGLGSHMVCPVDTDH